jgi:hypothetical protein
LIIAAFAVVFAGFFVFQSDYEGEGAVGLIPIDSQSIVVSSGTSEVAFNFFIDEALGDGVQSSHVRIAPGSDVSGVIKIGRYLNSQFVPMAEIRLSNVSAMDLGIVGYLSTGPEMPPEGVADALFTIDNLYAGDRYPQTVELTSGTVLAGTYGADDRILPPGERGSFSGKIVSGGAAVESVNTSGLFISSANSVPLAFGTVFGTQYYTDSLDGPSPRIMMSGTVAIEYPSSYALQTVLKSDNRDCGSLRFVDVDVTISDRATVTVGLPRQSYDSPRAGAPPGTDLKEYHFGLVSYRVVKSILHIEGALLLQDTYMSVSYMHVDGSVILYVLDDGDGIVEYQTDAASLGLEYTGVTVNSAYCATDQANTGKRTHFYLSLKSALDISDEIFIMGEYTITNDIVLASASGPSNIVVMPDSSLFIGSEASNRAVTVTVPHGAVVNAHGGSWYEVVYGTLIKPNDGSGDVPASDTHFVKGDTTIFRDIHTALKNAQSGDTVRLTRQQPDTVRVTRSCMVGEGVTLFLENNFLVVGNRSVLSVSGSILTGEHEILTSVLFDTDTALNVSSGGRVTFHGAYILISTLHIEEGGSVVIGSAAGEFADGAKYLIDGDLTLLNDAVATTVSVTGTINSECTMLIREKLVVGRPPELIYDIVNDAVVGKSTFLLEQGALAIVFGSPIFDGKNIMGNVVFTEFIIGDVIYAREYADADGITETKIEYLSADPKDKDFHGWYADPAFAHRFTINDTNNTVGNPHVLFGKFTPKQIRLTLYHNLSVDWAVNGVSFGSSGLVSVDYGSNVSVSVSVKPGHAGHPTIVRDNVLYVSGTEYSAKEDSVFKAVGAMPQSGHPLQGEPLLTEALLAVLIVTLVAILSIAIKKR